MNIHALLPRILLSSPFDRNDYYVVLSSQIGGEWVGEVDLEGEIVKWK